MTELITPQRAKQLLEEENALLIDVREPEEYASLHIPGAYLQPLSVLAHLPADDDAQRPVVFFCNSGNRTAAAMQKLEQRGHSRTFIIDGGLTAWQRAGLPVAKAQQPLPLSRQVHIAAGGLIVLFLLLGQQLPFFRIFVLFIGFGLLASGLTGACGMALLLKKMPWNKSS